MSYDSALASLPDVTDCHNQPAQGEETANENVVTVPEATPQVVEKTPPTRAEWKKMMRLYFTVRHPRVVQCGHSLDVSKEPRNNCDSCWFAFFNQHGELVQTADELFQAHGRGSLAQIRGMKFEKNFLKFMSTLAKWKAEQAAKEKSEQQSVAVALDTPGAGAQPEQSPVETATEGK